MKREDPITCHLIDLCIALWNKSNDAELKRRIISMSLSADTLDKQDGLKSLIELINDQLKLENLAADLESYVSGLQYIKITPEGMSRLFNGALSEKTKSAIGFYFVQMFKGHNVHKLPDLISGYATTEVV
ncbi:MAG: hypothetical protein WCG07_01255 [Candidatus Taylorbacteria bacterium]